MSDHPQSKPIIGLTGGVGAGKSLVARLMSQQGGHIIDADQLAQQALDEPGVRDKLQQWWGKRIFNNHDRIDRHAVADIIFADPDQRQRLEQLIHPRVIDATQRRIPALRDDPDVRFIVIDAPLLLEAGMDELCDRIVFVKADRQTRLDRLTRQRGWNAAEMDRREKNQWPLDKKLEMAHDVVDNDTSETDCLAQVRDLLARILT